MDETSQAREIFMVGLRNAHAMENQALSIMRPQLERIENYPDVARRLQQHIEETEGQQVRLENLLQSFGESSSTLKDAALSVVGSLAALGHTVADDEIIKNSLANFAFENFEIAAYKSLLVMCQLGGFGQAEAVLRQNLDEEVAMASWLDGNLSAVTERFVSLREAGASANV
jgi:ferritin-like metal-binding protein YciE